MISKTQLIDFAQLIRLFNAHVWLHFDIKSVEEFALTCLFAIFLFLTYLVIYLFIFKMLWD